MPTTAGPRRPEDGKEPPAASGIRFRRRRGTWSPGEPSRGSLAGSRNAQGHAAGSWRQAPPRSGRGEPHPAALWAAPWRQHSPRSPQGSYCFDPDHFGESEDPFMAFCSGDFGSPMGNQVNEILESPKKAKSRLIT